jgi:outer membrane receptor protein involved in Fe transport
LLQALRHAERDRLMRAERLLGFLSRRLEKRDPREGLAAARGRLSQSSTRLSAAIRQRDARAQSALGTLVTEATLADRMFVNDGNSESSPGYAIVNARLLTRAVIGLSGAEVTFGAQNIFDTKYISSVSVNAAGGKFYEPGSQRSLYIGVSLLGAMTK